MTQTLSAWCNVFKGHCWDALEAPSYLRQEMESYDCRKDLEDWHGLWTGPKKARECWHIGGYLGRGAMVKEAKAEI